jgi:glycosyltransferase involved in cell wall biosynthesis
MRVLVVSQYFWPENFRINELVQSLVTRGIEVDVLTGKPNYPEGKVFRGYRSGGTLKESWQGAQIFRVPLIPRGFRSGVRLFLNFLSFMIFGSLVGAWQLRKVKSDIVFVFAPSPLLQALPALLIARIKRVPLVVYVQDLWPESLEATGYVRNRLVIRLVEVLVKVIYRSSDLILVSSRPFISSIHRFSSSAEIRYYPNSVDESFTNPNAGLRPDVPALDDGFCVVFAGNVGVAQAVHVIIDAAVLLKDQPSVRLVVVGSGSEIPLMRERIDALGLDNLFLAGRFPVQAMPNLLSRASALLVTLANRPIFAATVPNKIQAYMAVGRPIIACMNGEGARIVSEARAGVAVPAEDGAGLARAILDLYQMPVEEREALGKNGRAYYREHFDHEKLVSQLIGHLEDAIGSEK